MAIEDSIGIVDDLKHILDNIDNFPKFFLYKQSDPNQPAVVFTDIKNNLIDTLEVKLVEQPVESGNIISQYKIIKPRIITAEIVFLPYSIKGSTEDMMNQIEDAKNQAELYLNNNELVIMKRDDPKTQRGTIVKQYNNLKIIKLRDSKTLNSLNYLSYDITFQQVNVWYANNGKVTSDQANNPTNSSTVKTK